MVEGVDVANHFINVDEMEAHRGMRRDVLLGGIDHVGRRRDETARLAFEGQVLGVNRGAAKAGRNAPQTRIATKGCVNLKGNSKVRRYRRIEFRRKEM